MVVKKIFLVEGEHDFVRSKSGKDCSDFVIGMLRKRNIMFLYIPKSHKLYSTLINHVNIFNEFFKTHKTEDISTDYSANNALINISCAIDFCIDTDNQIVKNGWSNKDIDLTDLELTDKVRKLLKLH